MARLPWVAPQALPPRWAWVGLILAVSAAGRSPAQPPPQPPEPAPRRLESEAAKPGPPNVKPAPVQPAARPQVVSQAKAKDRGARSEFLRAPGDDRTRYGDADWAEVPPWRQARFFGVRARGQFFVYVVDCSGSMVVEDRLARAKEELRRSVRGLVEPQRFQVIFYNDRAIPMPGGLPRSADLNGKSQFLAWLRLIGPDGETDPKPALGQALALRPDAVFLLSDGEFPEKTAEEIARRNARKVPIHCIDLSGGAAGDQLRQVAHDSGGTFVARPWAGP